METGQLKLKLLSSDSFYYFSPAGLDLEYTRYLHNNFGENQMKTDLLWWKSDENLFNESGHFFHIFNPCYLHTEGSDPKYNPHLGLHTKILYC